MNSEVFNESSIQVFKNYIMQNMFRIWSSILTEVGGYIVGGSAGKC